MNNHNTKKSSKHQEYYHRATPTCRVVIKTEKGVSIYSTKCFENKLTAALGVACLRCKDFLTTKGSPHQSLQVETYDLQGTRVSWMLLDKLAVEHY